MLSNKYLKCFLSLFLIGSASLLAMDYTPLNRGNGLELVLCASDTPTEVLEIIYENILNGFVSIPGGVYEIGSPKSEANRDNDERLHEISLSSFEIMEAAVTQEHYVRKMGHNPSFFKEDKPGVASFKIIEVNGKKIPVWGDHPVENVTWYEAKAYADALSQGDHNYNYRLPTEAELEVAFRGGTKTAYVSGNDESGLIDYVWYGNPTGQTQPVKSKLANSYRIHRSSVYEWTGDWYSQDYSRSVGLDPAGPTSGSDRVVRGGGFCYNAQYCRSASRNCLSPDSHDGNLGFRLVRTKK
jgi:formylglycine-generating enzyme required for sulfatase activity